MSVLIAAADRVVVQSTKLSGTSATSVYTAPSGTAAKFAGMVIGNTDTNAANITVERYEAKSTTSFKVYPLTSLAAKGKLTFEYLEGMTLEPGDELRVTSSVGSSVIHVTVWVLETLGRQ